MTAEGFLCRDAWQWAEVAALHQALPEDLTPWQRRNPSGTSRSLLAPWMEWRPGRPLHQPSYQWRMPHRPVWTRRQTTPVQPRMNPQMARIYVGWWLTTQRPMSLVGCARARSCTSSVKKLKAEPCRGAETSHTSKTLLSVPWVHPDASYRLLSALLRPCATRSLPRFGRALPVAALTYYRVEKLSPCHLLVCSVLASPGMT